MGILAMDERRRGDASAVDAGWAYSVGLLGLFGAIVSDGDPLRRALVAGLALAWSFRLGTYLLANRVVGKPEDGRYRRLREHFGAKAHGFFFVFFQVQAAWAVLFAASMVVAASNPEPLGFWGAIGVFIGLGAIVGESIADRQLARFRARPDSQGRTCREGLWRYSRHPNYFFEWLHWFAYPALAVGSGLWWVALLGPALMLVFLFKITGIPHTERQAIASRGDDYRRYQRETSMFIPWFPKDVTR